MGLQTIYNDTTVVGNISATGNIRAESSTIPVSVVNVSNTITFSNVDSNKVFHFNTTSNFLSALFPASLSEGFNVAIMNTGTKFLYLSAALPYRALNNTLIDQYAGAYVYRSNSQIFAVGGL